MVETYREPKGNCHTPRRACAIMNNNAVKEVRAFVRDEVLPVAQEYEHDDRFPEPLVAQMAKMGLFGAIIPTEYGGRGYDVGTYASIVEELSFGWMSLAGIINSHLMMAYLTWRHGSEEQRRLLLPAMCSGELRGGLALSEPEAGSDVQAITTVARRDGARYIVNGRKTYIGHGRRGQMLALLAKTDPAAEPRHRGMTLFLAEQGPGFTVVRDLPKLGYRGFETCELEFSGYSIPEGLRIGEEGEGFRMVMSALELGRINVAARGLGLARAAFEDSIRYAQKRRTFGTEIANHQTIQIKLAEMGTQIEASRLLVMNAAAKKDRGERCDLEAGMAKLFATETCQHVVLEALRIHGGAGYIKDLPIERYYRDAPLLVVGEGTNEIQRLIIARALLKRYPL
jgi:alkylation response protein AidB-like acyl-CoA dehydrogenase